MDRAIRDIVLVGGGLAGAMAAESLRQQGYDGTITIVGEEGEPPYERPPLSKDLLLGKGTVDDVYVHPRRFYVENRIELVIDDAATRIDRDAGRVHTASGRRLPFDRLLIATGASPRMLPLGDGELDGIMTLRTLDDSRRLAGRLSSVAHVTVVGAGWIGCEVAAAARTRGVDVTLVDPLDVPLERVLGREVGLVFRDLHADNGVDLRLGVGVSAASGAGRVEQVILTDGTVIATELVVVGVGVVPRTELADGAGLALDDGIVVDQTLTTSDPRILAAGDVANAWHPLLQRQLRVEHWANARNQGRTAGRNLLGAGEAYERLPYFFSDQYDLGMEYCGHADPGDDVIVRGSVASREFIAFWLRDDHVIAGMNVNAWDVADDIRSLIASGVRVDPARLADPEVALGDLTAAVA